jgi:hypothetical protein
MQEDCYSVAEQLPTAFLSAPFSHSCTPMQEDCYSVAEKLPTVSASTGAGSSEEESPLSSGLVVPSTDLAWFSVFDGHGGCEVGGCGGRHVWVDGHWAAR